MSDLRLERRRGFTIVELIIVLAVVGVLAAVILPTFSGVVEKAQSLSAELNLSVMNRQVKTAAVSGREHELLTIYSSLMDEYGAERVRDTLKTAAYDADDIAFILLKDCNEAENPQLYFPVYGDAEKSAEQRFGALPCVEYHSGGDAYLMQELNKGHTVQNTRFQSVYVVRSSLTLLDELELGDSCLVLVNGAGIALNGHKLSCGHLLLVDTEDRQKVTFRLQDGFLSVQYGMSALTVTDFGQNGQTDFTNFTPTAVAGRHIRLILTSALTVAEGNLLLPAEIDLEGSLLMTRNGEIRLPEDGELHCGERACLLAEGGFPALLEATGAAASLVTEDSSLIYAGVSAGSADIAMPGYQSPLSVTRPTLCTITPEACRAVLTAVSERLQRGVTVARNPDLAGDQLERLCDALALAAAEADRQRVRDIGQAVLADFSIN